MLLDSAGEAGDTQNQNQNPPSCYSGLNLTCATWFFVNNGLDTVLNACGCPCV